MSSLGTSLDTIPTEIRKMIFEYCTKGDLVNFAVCSKFWHIEIVPILWNDISVKWWHLAEDNVSCKTLNLHNTHRLSFAGRKSMEQNLRNYEAFNFGIILRNCDPALLTSLKIENFVIKDGLRLLSQMLPMLKILELSCINDNESFGFVSNFRCLERVSLCGCTIEDSQVMAICALRGLKMLELIHCNRLTEQSLKYISGMVQLKQLKLRSGWQITSDQLDKTLTRLPNLVHLDLCCSNIDDNFFTSAVGNFKMLEFLNISRTRITDLSLAAISRLKNLKHLDMMECSKITSKGLASLHQLSHLTSLGLCGTWISDEGLLHVSKLVSLTELDMYACDNITDVGLQHISLLIKLLSLDIGRIHSITNQGFTNLHNLRHLQRLSIENLKVTNESLKTVAKLDYLKQLNISFCDNLTDDGLHHLSNMKNLKKVVCAEADGLTKDGFIRAGLPVSNY